MSNVDVDALRKNLLHVERQVEAWCRNKTNASRVLRDQHFQRMAALQGTSTSLEEEIQRMRLTSQQVQERLKREEDEISSADELLQSVSAEKDSMDKKLQAITETLCIESSEAQKREAAFKQQDALVKRKLGALNSVLQMYQSNLGLQFIRTGSNLRMVLTHIDPADHMREFTFSVVVQPDESYSVTSCQPEVAKLPELIAALNKSGDFASFVRAMRREFRQMVVAAS